MDEFYRCSLNDHWVNPRVHKDFKKFRGILFAFVEKVDTSRKNLDEEKESVKENKVQRTWKDRVM